MKRTKLCSLLLLSVVAVSATLLHADIPSSPLIFEKIWDGVRVGPGKYPETFFISMTTPTDDGNVDQICTGVLVHPRLILTAAHCFKNSSIQVVGNGTNSTRKKFHGTVASVARKKAHPSYRASRGDSMLDLAESAKWDIAFLKLNHSLDRITLPSIQLNADFASAQQLTGKTARLVGYGHDQFSRSQSGVAGIKRTGENLISHVVPGMIYLNRRTGGALPGDSGGPVFIESDTGRTLVGLLHSYVHENGRYVGSTAHLFSPESLCWVKNESGIDFLPSLTCSGATP